jgi:hypothetical protein
MHRFLTTLVVSGALMALARAGDTGKSESFSSQSVEFFEKRVRPVLAEHCFQCHSSRSEKLKAGLHLDSRQGVLTGGDSGPAAIPGDPDGSLVVKAIRYTDSDLQMPPKKGKLPDAAIADLVAWIKMGLPWGAESGSAPVPAKQGFEITERDRAHWAFQPVRRPALPPVGNTAWVANGIDAFVLAGLEAKGIEPNPRATRRELIRRLYFDLLGLPPTPDEVEAFSADTSAEAYRELVDRLLARPEYGERWARHWLDVVRFAQSNGYERDGEKPLAWRYRDYVIRAFNEDKGYDRFVQEQIAGDELPDATPDGIVATGFQRLGVWDDEPDDKAVAEFDELDDIVSTAGTAFLGLTLGCARCHDHKFDPISQADYYRFLAFFRNIRLNDNPALTLDSPNYVPLATASQIQEWVRQKERRVQTLESQIACAVEGKDKAALQEKLHAVRSENWAGDWALAVRERTGQALPTRVLVRGNPTSPGVEVEPGFPAVLGVQTIPKDSGRSAVSTGGRLALARWIGSRENPLTARVAANRVWHYHFGQGIVRTTADFGRADTLPTNSGLLDWLASEFMESGWSLKRLHRLIVLSNTYQMSSHNENARGLALDPSDDLLWRQRLRRLDAECVRDAILQTSGELNPEMGGRGFFPHLDGEVLAGESRPGLDWEISSPAEQARRSIYIYVRRTMLVPLLEAFDYSNTSSPLQDRPVTTVAPQALMLLNSEWTQKRAEAFAARLIRQVGQGTEARVKHAFQLALERAPSKAETEAAARFLERQAAALSGISSRLIFQPDVPSSLFEGYLSQLQPEDFLHGPRNGWAYYRGRWSRAYEGIRTMDKQRGPFALWTRRAFADGVLRARLLVQPTSESGSLLLRASAPLDTLHGYEVVFDPRQQRVLVRRHAEKVEVLAETPAAIAKGQSCTVRIALGGARLRVWINAPCDSSASGSAKVLSEAEPASVADTIAPLIDIADAKPIQGTGYVGVRPAGGGLSLDELTLETATGTAHVWEYGNPTELGRRDGQSGLAEISHVEQRAWESLCLLLLNLNEFIYVD